MFPIDVMRLTLGDHPHYLQYQTAFNLAKRTTWDAKGQLEKVVRKRTRKQPSVIASQPFQIYYRSANYLKVYFILPLAIMQHFRDNEK